MNHVGYRVSSVRQTFFSRNEVTPSGEGVVDAGTCDGLLRRAARGIDRRRSLRVLGAGTLGLAAARGGSANASKAGKKAKKKCKKQGNSCRAFAQDLCAEFQQGQDCVDLFTPCCASIQKCNAPAFFACVNAGLIEILSAT